VSMLLNPYISFRDTAKQAMAFYAEVFGGELTSMTFEQGGMPHADGEGELIMHSQLTTDAGFTIMGSDTPSSMGHTPGGAITVSLSGDDEKTLTGYYEQLSAGGTVSMPLEKAPWGDSFGQCTDKFGVNWMVNISGAAG
jgi:PhnB protein